MTDNELVELLEDRLAPEDRARVLAELEQCSDCRSVARQWAVTSSRLEQSPAPLEATAVPAHVGAYELDEILGAGATGLVFRGRDVTLDRKVAIKIVRAADDAARERALDEGRLLATVRHRNVITVHAAGVGEGVAYLVMELVEGTSLDRVLERGPLPWRTAVRWFRGVASGLASAHAVGVIHRDIKPANLLLDRDDLRVADFGLASRTGGAPAGTPAYLAPEVAAGESATARSDQFSYFVTLYEALAGRRPFAGRDLTELRTAWRAGATSWSRIPARLRSVIARGLALEPAARWPDMLAVERALHAATTARRWPWLAAAAGVALTAGIAVAATRGDHCDVPAPSWRVGDGALQRALAAYEARWTAAYAEACERPAQKRCLDEARARVDAIVASLGDKLDAQALAGGTRAIASLANPRRCIVAPEPPPRDPLLLHRIAALTALGRTREAWQALPPPEQDSPELALLRGRIAHERLDLVAAETALRHAAELASKHDIPPVLVDAQTELGLVIGFAQDRHDAGAAYVDLALQTALRLGDRRRATVARGVQGLIASARGDRNKAVALLTAALLEQDNAEPLEVAALEMRLGVVLRDARRTQEARPHVERARELRRSVLGEQHPLVAAADVEIGITEAAAGDYAAAIKRYRATIDRLTTTFGSDDVALAAPLSALGTAQLQSGDYAGAEATLSRALLLRRTAYGDNHLDVARAQLNLASTYYYQGKLDAAIEAYRAADAIERSLLGAHHPDVAIAKSGLALALQARERFDEARIVIDEVIAIYRELPGHDLALADALATSGMIAYGANRKAEARRALEDSYAIQRRVLGDDHVDLAVVQSLLGELHLDLGQLADAERLITTARALRMKHGVAPQLIAENEYLLAMIAWKQGRRAPARDHARSALKLLGDARPELRATIAKWLATH